LAVALAVALLLAFLVVVAFVKAVDLC
jgi:hypothetical protein